MSFLWYLSLFAFSFDHLHGAGLPIRRTEQIARLPEQPEQRLVWEACEHIPDPSDEKVEQCHGHFRDAIKASKMEYCGETASSLSSCEQYSAEDPACEHQEAENATCINTVWETYLQCQKDGRVRPLTLILCANRRLNISDAPPLPFNVTSIPLVVTTAIPFFTNGSIAFWSTTATLFTSDALRTAPAPTPPAFSETGLWTNTTGSFTSTNPIASVTGNVPVPVPTDTDSTILLPPIFSETGLRTDTVGSFPTSPDIGPGPVQTSATTLDINISDGGRSGTLSTYTSLPTDASAVSSLVEGTIPTNAPVEGQPPPAMPPCPYEASQA